MTEAMGTPPPDDVGMGRLDAPSAALIRLAEAYGISIDYTSWNGESRRCSTRAIRGALSAMGVASGDDAACQREVDRLAAGRALRMVPPVVVSREGQSIEVPIHAPRGKPVSAIVRLESGEALMPESPMPAPGPAEDGRRVVEVASLRIRPLPAGYHTLEVTLGPDSPSVRCPIIVTPERLSPPVHHPRPWGLMVHPPSIRSARSWGVGDLADLKDLAILGAGAGADFVVVTPLCAAEPVPPLTPSPYLPTSRRFIHPLLIRVEDVPEVAYLDSADRALIAWLGEAPREASGNRLLLDRDASWTAKKASLEEVFKAPLSSARAALFEAFREEQGQPLTDFATWCAIVEERSSAGEGGEWPHGLSHPDAADVTQFRDTHPDRVRFYAWLQWVADEQRASAQAGARVAGMRIGMVTDLAVGVHPTGADAWALGDVLARGVGVGAPPDMYNQLGQNWSQPPWQPEALREVAYRPFRDIVRATLRHAGAIRVDHILGLFRLWWVPEGCRPDDGVYVRYDHEALVGILVLEAHRAGAIVIGEDLGTVEPWVSEYLASRGILGTSIMWFEKGGYGEPLSPERFRPHVLASVTVHDLPPTAAYLSGEHVRLRESLGLLAGSAERTRAEAEREREDMARMLVENGWLSPDATGDAGEVLLGLHRALMASPCALVGVSVPDLVGDVRTLNQPGTDTEYPNWKIPLCDGRGTPVPLDTLFDHPRTRALLEAIQGPKKTGAA